MLSFEDNGRTAGRFGSLGPNQHVVKIELWFMVDSHIEFPLEGVSPVPLPSWINPFVRELGCGENISPIGGFGNEVRISLYERNI